MDIQIVSEVNSDISSCCLHALLFLLSLASAAQLFPLLAAVHLHVGKVWLWSTSRLDLNDLFLGHAYASILLDGLQCNEESEGSQLAQSKCKMSSEVVAMT